MQTFLDLLFCKPSSGSLLCSLEAPEVLHPDMQLTGREYCLAVKFPLSDQPATVQRALTGGQAEMAARLASVRQA